MCLKLKKMSHHSPVNEQTVYIETCKISTLYNVYNGKLAIPLLRSTIF